MELNKINDSYKALPHILTDILGFWGGNALIHSASSDYPKPKISKIVIFGISDFLTRTRTLVYPMAMDSWGDKTWMTNARIALGSFLAGSIYDIIVSKNSFSKIFTDNLFLNGIGMASNVVIDKVIPTDVY